MQENKKQKQILDNLLSKKIAKKQDYFSDEDYDKLGIYGGSYCELQYDDEDEEDEEDW